MFHARLSISLRRDARDQRQYTTSRFSATIVNIGDDLTGQGALGGGYGWGYAIAENCVILVVLQILAFFYA